MLPRRGTRGVMCSRSRWPICSMSSMRTPEWPRIKEFMRIKMAPLTHDSGIEVWLRGSRSGSESPSSIEITPACWCCNRAPPKRSGSSVLVSAVEDAGDRVSCEQGKEWAVLTTATETGADAVHALPSVHFIDDNVSALLKSFADASGIIEDDVRVVSRGGGNGGDGKIVSVDEDRISISANELFSTCRKYILSCRAHR